MHSIQKASSTQTLTLKLTDVNADCKVSPAKEDITLMEIDKVDSARSDPTLSSVGSNNQMSPMQHDLPHLNDAVQFAGKANSRYFTHYRYGPQSCLQKRATYPGKEIKGDDQDHPKLPRTEKATCLRSCQDILSSHESNTRGSGWNLLRPAHTCSKIPQTTTSPMEFGSRVASLEKEEPLDLSTHRKVCTDNVTKTDENANIEFVLKPDKEGVRSDLDAGLTYKNQNILDLSIIVEASNKTKSSGQGIESQRECDSETEIASPASITDDDSLESASDNCLSDCSSDSDPNSISCRGCTAAQHPDFGKTAPGHQINTQFNTMQNRGTSEKMVLLNGTDNVDSTEVRVTSGPGAKLSINKCPINNNGSAQTAGIDASEEKPPHSEADDKETTALRNVLNGVKDQGQVVNIAQKETCSTKRVTDWAVGIFRRWIQETPARAALPDLLKMTVPQINTYLCKFLVDARKTNGSRYPSKSLQAMGQGLLRYVRNNRLYSQRECGSVDGLFKPVNQVLSMELRRTLFYESLQGRMPKVRQRKRNVTKNGKERRVSERTKELKNTLVQVDENVENNTTHCCVSRDSVAQDAVHSSNQPGHAAPQGEMPPLVSSDVTEKNKSRPKVEISSINKDGEIAQSILPASTSDGLPMSSRSLSSGNDTGRCTSVKGKSTLRNTRWAYQHFNRWRLAQGELGKALIPDIVEMSPDEVNCYLADYIANVMKTDGTSYIPSCLYSLACGLLRHVRSEGRTDLDFMNSKDTRFADFQNALATRVKSLGQHQPKSRPRLPSVRLLSSSQEEKLWQYHVFGLETAKSLQYSVFYYNFKLFGIKSYVAHRNLRRVQFSVTRQKGVNSVLFDSRDNGLFPEAGGSRLVYREEPGSRPGSLVELYEVYLTAIGPTGPFYKRLLGLQGPALRFSKQSVGIRSLYVMWTDIWEAVVLE